MALALALVLFAQSPAASASPSPPAAPTMADVLAATTDADWRPLDPENTLYLELPSGRVVLELAPAFAPAHAANIRALAREGYFEGLAVLRVQDNYVTQWGDPFDEDPAKKRPVKAAKPKLAGEFTVPVSAATPFTPLPERDGYAPEVGFADGFHAARDPQAKATWLVHCYGALGVARDVASDSGSGTSLYAVIGHAPRHLDRNITVVGRVVQGMERLSALPRGTGRLGFYETPEERLRLTGLRVAADVPKAERTELQVMRTDTKAFAALVETRRNRREEWYKRPAGHVEICNVPIPVRPLPPPKR